MKSSDDYDDLAPEGGYCEQDNTPSPLFPAFPPYPPYPPFAPYPAYPHHPTYWLPAVAPTEPQPGELPSEQSEGADGIGEEPSGEPPLVFPSSVAVLRPDDLLVCTLRFVGFAFFRDPPRLHRAADDAYIVVEFPPQSFGEEAFLLVSDQSVATPDPQQSVEVSQAPAYPKQNVPGGDDPVPPSLPAARIRMAGRSRVVVAMPADQESVGFDFQSIFSAIGDWPMRLAPVAVPDLSTVQVGPQAPAQNVTALEIPYRLLLSPLNPAMWRHSLAPVVSNGRTELWHTRLTNTGEATQTESSSRVRAVWSPDYRPPALLSDLYTLISLPGSDPPQRNPALIRMSLDPVDRAMLVTVMSGFDAKRNKVPYLPLSSEAKRLHLTSLGGLLDVEGSWDPDTLPDGIDLEQWRHLASLGRDHYVRVVYAGWLCPFGHAASLVKVTERRFQSLGSDPAKRMAVLRQRFFLVVRQPVVTYSGANHVHAGHDFPFTQVELLTRVTPDLTDPGFGASSLDPSGKLYKDLGISEPRELFWPMVPANNKDKMTDFLFHIAATDIGGTRVTFAMPLLFVGKPANDVAHTDPSGNLIRKLKQAYNASLKRQAKIAGANIKYAPTGSTDQGDSTTLPTADMTFRAGDLISVADPDFYPEVDCATVGVRPVQKLLAQPDFTREVRYPDFYAQHGFDAGMNAGQIFLQFTSAKTLQFGGAPTAPKSDALGALATPHMNLLGLSKIMGTVSGKDLSSLGSLAAGQFDPKDFFADATLLGGIKLGEIVPLSTSLAGAEVPKLLSRDFPDHVEATFDWSTSVTNPDGRNLIIPDADQSGAGTKLMMSGIVRTPLDPSQPTSFQATAELNNFKVNLFGFIILWFEDLRFNAKSGQKPDVFVTMRAGQDAVTFGGPLEFVNTLRQYIPSNGFSDPPSLVVTPSGISAAYSLNLPAIEVGVFALANVGLSASFSLPFDGTPAVVNFAFSTREHPFSLTVALLGGGGFFGIGISSYGVREIEAALEFGAVAAIDLGVASGSVEIKAGIYFHWLEPSPPDQASVELAGYVRICGELCVLSLISVSLTFYLQLAYQKDSGRAIVYGEADLTVEIDIFMFSKSVSVRCRREFVGSDNADPKFIDQIPTPEVWSDYCDAFASEAA